MNPLPMFYERLLTDGTIYDGMHEKQLLSAISSILSCAAQVYRAVLEPFREKNERIRWWNHVDEVNHSGFFNLFAKTIWGQGFGNPPWSNPGSYGDFRLVGLSGIQAPKVDLHGSDFSRADLSNANFCGSYLPTVDLSDADLHDTNLEGAVLRSAAIVGTNLHGANLERANLCRAVMRNANIAFSNLQATDLQFADFSGANLNHADISYSDCWRASFRDAKLNSTEIKGADLRGTELYKH